MNTLDFPSFKPVPIDRTSITACVNYTSCKLQVVNVLTLILHEHTCIFRVHVTCSRPLFTDGLLPELAPAACPLNLTCEAATDAPRAKTPRFQRVVTSTVVRGNARSARRVYDYNYASRAS